jgi:hypothetical protein
MLLLIAAPARAGDVTVTLSDNDQKIFKLMCEAAVWANKMAFEGVCSYFEKKLQPPDPKPPDPPKVDEPDKAK